MSDFAGLSIQTYDPADQPNASLRRLASTTILVLRAVLHSMKALVVTIRAWREADPRD